ncbi:MAG TPA: single-stranded-DNA-specific exonuclease RecJ [Candidatus Limnocylindrales bacterium]|nr:single-stranded-DNA-specific exonuclease RecJ [Candidatus Limnocylindrales bacterium]
MKCRWSLAPPQPLLAGQLAAQLKIAPLLAQCLLNRGFSEPPAIEKFLQPRLKDLADPFLLPDMAVAVERLLRAREQKEPLVIFGDYDVDGVTSTALLLEVLRALGWKADFYLPNRMDEGYGLSADGVENCLKKFPVTLLLAVDCGSTAVDTIHSLRARGVDVIVLDHHQVSSPAPEAVALVNPQLQCREPRVASREQEAGCHSTLDPRPSTELCSVGLAFKLAHALVKRGREKHLPGAAEFDLRPLLDLVALGTIADLVPLTGENRILVSAGLQRLNTTQRPGLVALKSAAQSPPLLGTYDVGFQLAPRLNAAGRLETAEASLQLLLAPTLAEAMPLAQNLDARNRERQKIERSIVEEVTGAVRAKFNPETDFVIVEGQLLWHIGVVGIVASRMLQEFYRPTIIIGGEGDEWRGSGRSIAGFDLAAALRECSDLLVRHGGHAMAAGLSIQPDKIGALRERLNALAQRALKPEDLQPPIRLDAEVGLDEMTLDMLHELSRLKPTGQGNPGVQFCARNLTHARPLQRIGADKQHVKLWVTDTPLPQGGYGAAGGTVLEAVWWNGGNESLPVGTFDLAFAPQINQFNGNRTVQLKVLDWQSAS